MKLRAELPARQISGKPRPGVSPGEVPTSRGGGAKAGTQAVSVRGFALSLGLPKDALSSSILSLAKFFSLPLDAKLILQLRQQALSLTQESGQGQGQAKTAQEGGPEMPDPPLPAPLRSAALAAAAVAGKGVVLSPEALGRYAAALAAEDLDDEAPEDEPGADADREDPPGDGGASRFSEPRGGSDFAERIEARHPLLGVLNRIPGKDGRRWITLPFSCESGGVDFKVSLRIVLADTNGIPWKAERMALDVRTPRQRWSFMLETGGDGQALARAVFGARPPLKKQAERSLRKLLGSVAGKVVLRDISGGAFFEEEAGAEQWGP